MSASKLERSFTLWVWRTQEVLELPHESKGQWLRSDFEPKSITCQPKGSKA